MKLVLVEWLDSHSGDGWQSLDEIKRTNRPIRCRSVGWLVAESDGHKTLVPHMSGDEDETIVTYGRGDLTIPDDSILKITVISSRSKPRRKVHQSSKRGR